MNSIILIYIKLKFLISFSLSKWFIGAFKVHKTMLKAFCFGGLHQLCSEVTPVGSWGLYGVLWMESNLSWDVQSKYPTCSSISLAPLKTFTLHFYIITNLIFWCVIAHCLFTKNRENSSYMLSVFAYFLSIFVTIFTNSLF